MNRTVDFSLGPWGTKPEVDLSITNVNFLSQRAQGQCIFDLVDVSVSGTVKNGYFLVNATIDMSSPDFVKCR